MEGSKVDFHTWYTAMALMTFSKKTISVAEMQRQLDHPKYDTIWRLMHKIRAAMRKRDALCQLQGAIEFDEGYFAKATSEKVKLKRGRGSQKQVNVAVMAESTPLEDLETGIMSRQSRFFKMKVLGDHKLETISKTIKDSFADKSIVFSDKSTSYINTTDYVDSHQREV